MIEDLSVKEVNLTEGSIFQKLLLSSSSKLRENAQSIRKKKSRKPPEMKAYSFYLAPQRGL